MLLHSVSAVAAVNAVALNCIEPECRASLKDARKRGLMELS